MAIPNIPLDVPLSFVLEENSFTLGKLPAHPLAAAYTPQFDAFQTAWFATFTARANLEIAVGKAEGAIAAADDALDDFIDVLDRNLLILTKNDRTAPIYAFFFGAQTPSEMKRPVLKEELTTVKAWVPSLQTSPYPPIAALAPQLTTLITSADAAVAQHQAVVQSLRDFDLIGGKKKLIDDYNALRQTTYGELSAIPHQNPAQMLPPTFGDRFFRHGLNKGITGIKSPERVQTKMETLQKKLTAAQDHLNSLQTKAEKKAEKKAQEAKDKAALDQAKAAEAAAKQKRKDLQKQLKADKKKV